MPPFRGFLGLAIILCGICLVRLAGDGIQWMAGIPAEVGRHLAHEASGPWLAVALSLLVLPLAVTTLARLMRR